MKIETIGEHFKWFQDIVQYVNYYQNISIYHGNGSFQKRINTSGEISAIQGGGGTIQNDLRRLRGGEVQ